MSFPNFNANGDLPLAVHKATLIGVMQRFATGTPKRQQVAQRLERIFKIAVDTKMVARFTVTNEE